MGLCPQERSRPCAGVDADSGCQVAGLTGGTLRNAGTARERSRAGCSGHQAEAGDQRCQAGARSSAESDDCESAQARWHTRHGAISATGGKPRHDARDVRGPGACRSVIPPGPGGRHGQRLHAGGRGERRIECVPAETGSPDCPLFAIRFHSQGDLDGRRDRGFLQTE